MNSYYTHRQYLRNELNKLDFTKKNICLEFGTGEGSALVFKEFTDKYPNLTVIAYESDQQWLQITKDKYESENYKFFYVTSWSSIFNNENFNSIYDLVFVDQAPWDARILSIDYIKSRSKKIILHDYDYFNKGICEDIYSTIGDSFFAKKYSKEFDFVSYFSELPPTLVMTNKKSENIKVKNSTLKKLINFRLIKSFIRLFKS